MFLMMLFQDQYQFVYDTLLEYTRGIDSRFPVAELANQIKEKAVKDKKLKKNQYTVEYAVREGPRDPAEAPDASRLIPVFETL